ncbi:MAG: hypothetical protein AB1480_00335 [Nitrospirota bacterium]
MNIQLKKDTDTYTPWYMSMVQNNEMKTHPPSNIMRVLSSFLDNFSLTIMRRNTKIENKMVAGMKNRLITSFKCLIGESIIMLIVLIVIISINRYNPIIGLKYRMTRNIRNKDNTSAPTG